MAKRSYFFDLKKIKRFFKDTPLPYLLLKLGFSAVVVVFLFVGILVLSVYLGAFGKLPSYYDLKEIRNYTASEVFSEDDVLLGKYYIENRVNATFEEISPNIVSALIATEDARFFEHNGVDTRALLRVFFKSLLLRDDSSGGGSTLSQQLAKNLFHRKKYKFLSLPINKTREMFIARRLEKEYSKEELLNLYLNTVPFSENIYGVKVASQRFFNTSPKKIKPEEAAVLIGMLKATTKYNPVQHPERATGRRNVVLNQMKKYGYLTAPMCDSLTKLPIKLEYFSEGHNTGLATYFRENLRQELEKILEEIEKPDGTKYDLYTDGLKIKTTINSTLQKYAEEAVLKQMHSLQKIYFEHWKNKKYYGSDKLVDFIKRRSDRYKKLKDAGFSEKEIDESFDKIIPMTVYDWKKGNEKEVKMSPLDSIKYYLSILNAGFLAMDPKTGKIKAWVGGIQHKYFKYDHVKSKRQVGSTFKPIVYSAALEKGIIPCDYIDNELVIYSDYDDWKPENADGNYGGVYSMEGGLSHSVNTVTVDLLFRTGIDEVKTLAENMGISSEIPELPSIGLGAIDVSLWDMIKVYGVFANAGKKVEPYYLLSIENNSGKIIYKNETEETDEEPILTEENNAIMIQMLQSVVDSGTAKRLRYHYGFYNDIAGKTGTTQNNSDGWFIGFTPNLVAGSWVGGEYPEIRFRSLSLGQGANTALPIWAEFMKKMYKDKKFAKAKQLKFPQPDSSILALLDCPPYFENRMLADLYYLEKYDDKSSFDDFFGIFSEKDSIEVEERRQRRISREAERIRKNNEKLEKKRQRKKEREKRKKKRKKFFDRLFGAK